MITERIITKFENIIYDLRFKCNLYWTAGEKKLLASFKNVPLTSSEKKEIRRIWGNIDLTYHKMLKSIRGFDPLYCSNQYYGGKILPILNPRLGCKALENKSLFDNYRHEILFPKTIVKNVRGIFFKEGEVVTLDRAVEICSQEPEFIIKPSIGSYGGKNVLKISSGNIEKIRTLFKKYKQNFIVQKVVKQSANTAKFNPSSLNTFRITTLFLNGKCTILVRVFKFGASGTTIDNASDGGYFIGINKTSGELFEFAFNKKVEKIAKINNCVFAQTQMSNFYKVENFAIEKHTKLFPNVGIIGWDLALDEEENVVCVEWNFGFPGCFSWQFCCGPFFGDRTNEVIDYAKRYH
jgi:hypothetical protein